MTDTRQDFHWGVAFYRSKVVLVDVEHTVYGQMEIMIA